MRINNAAAALLFILTVTPLRAQTPVAAFVAEPQAVKLNPERAALKRAVLKSAAARDSALAVPGAAGPSAIVFRSQEAELQAAVERIKNSRALADAAIANFDNSVVRWGDVSADGAKIVTVQDGPPGSGGGRVPQQEPRSGPPGSGGQTPPRQGPPGSGGQTPPRQGPPGSGTPPGGNPPSTTPPSRPAPVWRSNFPAPAPNWWNTDFNGYDWWTGLPAGYDRPHKDQSNPDTFYYYSGWYRWRDTFVTAWERTEDRATITRTAANQNQVHTRTLTSEVYRESKDCYYQAVYRYDWVQGGFNGSHWEERFDHYKARCIRNPREYGRPVSYTTHVSFDMGMAQGQDLPWEADVVAIRYDGRGQPRYDYSGASYKYAARLDDQRANSESVTLVAGSKVLRAPEADKVQAFLRVNAGKIEFVINDDRASYYQGETLRVSAKIVRRVVWKEKGRLWGWNERRTDTVIHNAPVDIVADAGNPQSITDLTAGANGPKPANFVSQSVFIESWSFTRVNSRISTGAAVGRGRGNEVAY